MALFGSKKKTEEAKPATEPGGEASRNVGTRAGASGVAHVLKNPRITEKASMHQETGVYTFDVAVNATKSEIAAAVRSVYKVSPRKIRIVQIPAKQTRSMRSGRKGMRASGKKAYVYLKSGETITIA